MATLWHPRWLTDLPNITQSEPLFQSVHTPIKMNGPHSNCLAEEIGNLTWSFKHETNDLSSVTYQII